MYSNDVKQPIEYFIQLFADEVWRMICDETNHYAEQADGTELKCTESEIKRYVGILLYLAVIRVPTYRMAWAPNFKLTSTANALNRTRFEKIKKIFISTITPFSLKRDKVVTISYTKLAHC